MTHSTKMKTGMMTSNKQNNSVINTVKLLNMTAQQFSNFHINPSLHSFTPNITGITVIWIAVPFQVTIYCAKIQLPCKNAQKITAQNINGFTVWQQSVKKLHIVMSQAAVIS